MEQDSRYECPEAGRRGCGEKDVFETKTGSSGETLKEGPGAQRPREVSSVGEPGKVLST